jgi:hypothetical protein
VAICGGLWTIEAVWRPRSAASGRQTGRAGGG